MGYLPARGWRADGAALVLGLLAALALPPVHAIPVLFVAVPCLLVLIERAPGQWAAARRGFWFGFGQHLIGLYWITEAILLESARYWWFVPIAVPALSALMALFIAGPCWLAKAVPEGWRRVAMLGGAWVLFDLARQFVGTGFPWNPWGSVWAIPGVMGDVMIQPAAWVGTPGLTMLTVLLAAAPIVGWRGVWGAVAALLIWGAAGVWRLQEVAMPAPGVEVVLVQGNVAHGELDTRAGAFAMFERQLRLTAEGVATAGAAPSVVVWPESAASPFLVDQDAGARAAIAEASRPAPALLAQGAKPLGAIVGSLRLQGGQFDAAHPPYNSMIAMTPAGDVAGVYDKWHLVPFGEFAPSWVPLAIQIVPGVFAFGSGPKTLGLPGLPPFGALICYEAVYPGQVVDEANRPDWLVNITNDNWFGNSTGPRQHLAAARMRAVEEGLPLLRAANTGISAGFDAWGRELGRLGIGVTGELTLALPGKRPPTSFARLGLVIPGLLGAMLVAVATIRPREKHDYV